MNGQLRIHGKTIMLVFAGEATPYATADDPITAVKILDRAARFQDRRQYTNSARTYRKAEELPGFQWLNFPTK